MSRGVPQDHQIYVLPPPVGGVNTRTYHTELPEGEFEMVKNFEVAQDLGAWVTRKGQLAWNSTLPVASKPVRGGFRFYFGSTPTRHMLMIAGTDIWNKAGAAGNFTSIKSGVTENRDWSFAAITDYCFIANGVDAMQRWDGTTMRNAGFPAPASTATVALGAGGVLTGTYSYKITATYDSNAAHESSASSASANVIPAGQQVDLTAIPTVTNATGRRIYRTKAGGTTYFFVATIADNTTTIYSDNIADTALGTEQAPTDNGVPPTGQFNIMWNGRHIVGKTAAQPQRVFLSAIISTEKSPTGGTTVHGAGVEIFPASHYLDVGDDNTPLTGFGVVNDSLVVFKQDQIWNLRGDDAQDMVSWRAQSKAGCIAPKTIVDMGGTLFFLGRNNGSPTVWTYDGSGVNDISLPIEPTLRANVKSLGDTSAQPVQPCAVQFRGQYVLCYPKTGLSTFEIATLDTRPPKPRWMFHDNIEASVFIPLYGAADAGELYYGSFEEARVLQYESKLTDYNTGTTSAVIASLETGWMNLGWPFHLKVIHWIDLYGREGDQPSGYDADPGDTLITVERSYDFDTVDTELNCSDVNVSTATKVFGRKLWHHRVHCEGNEGALMEQGYLMKMVITTTAPIKLHKVVVCFTVRPPETFESNATS